MQERCEKHLFEEAIDVCRQCAHQFCAECLVYSFGPKQPPYCVPCAVAAAGIRTTAGGRPTLERKQMRRMMKERRLARRGAGHAVGALDPTAGEDVGEVPEYQGPPNSYRWTLEAFDPGTAAS